MAVSNLTRSLLRFSPSLYAEEFRVIKKADGDIGPWGWEGYEFLKEIHENMAARVVVRKAAQLGFTETLLNRVLHLLDCWALDVLYILPGQGDASDFSAGRFKVAYDGSPRLQELFTAVDNVQHKRAGIANLYLRGSHSRSKLKSIPVAGLFLDEFDEMNAANVQLARDRLKGQLRSWEVVISTPSLPGVGIDAEYKLTDQRQFHVPCPSCDQPFLLEFENLEPMGDGVGIKCSLCSFLIDEGQKPSLIASGKWVAQRESDVPGYWISGLYSPTQTWKQILREHERAENHDDPRVLREWMNGTLGIPFVEKGFALDIERVREFSNVAAHKTGRSSSVVAIAGGVDAGVRGHYLSIVGLEPDGKEKVLLFEKLQSFTDIHVRLAEYGATAVVIDAQPNTESSRKLQRLLWDKDISAWLCYYSANMKGRIKWDYTAADGPQVVAHRTESLSETMSRVGVGDTLAPADSPVHAWEHLAALRRVVEPNRDGNLITKWENDGPDHFAHALNSARLGLEQVGGQFVEDTYDDETEQHNEYAGGLGGGYGPGDFERF